MFSILLKKTNKIQKELERKITLKTLLISKAKDIAIC